MFNNKSVGLTDNVRPPRTLDDDDGVAVAASTKKPHPGILNATTVRLIVEGGYLTTTELGRFLFLVHPNVEKAFSDNRQVMWKALCVSYWGQTRASLILESSKLSPEECFRSLILPKKKSCIKIPPKLKHSPSDYVIFVELQVEGKIVMAEAFSGEEAPRFFREGRVYVERDEKPALVKHIEYSRDKNNSHMRRLKGSRFVATVRLLRLSDRKTIELFGGVHHQYVSDWDYDLMDDGTVAISRAYTKEKPFCPLGGLIDGPLWERLDGVPPSHFLAMSCEVDERLKIQSNEPNRELMARLWRNPHLFSWGVHPSGEQEIHGLEISIGLKDCSDPTEFVPLPDCLIPSDIQFAHILENMRGWKDV